MLVVGWAYLSLKASNRFFNQGKEVQQFIKSKQQPTLIGVNHLLSSPMMQKFNL